MLCGSLERRGVWGRMDTCIHMAELLCSSPETITLLLINCVSRSVVSDSLPRYGQQPTRLLCPWDSPGKNTGVGSHSLLQGIFPTQGSNAGLPHFWQILYHLSHQGSLQCKIKSFLKKKKTKTKTQVKQKLRVKPSPPALEAQSLNHQTTREVPESH